MVTSCSFLFVLRIRLAPLYGQNQGNRKADAFYGFANSRFMTLMCGNCIVGSSAPYAANLNGNRYQSGETDYLI